VIEKQKQAWRQVALAIKRGELVRPDTCQECGAHDLIHAHHEDYDRPLDVEFLCVRCHFARHGWSRGGPLANLNHGRHDYCKRGHKMTDDNIRWTKVGRFMKRRCRECCRIRDQHYEKQKRARIAPPAAFFRGNG